MPNTVIIVFQSPLLRGDNRNSPDARALARLLPFQSPLLRGDNRNIFAGTEVRGTSKFQSPLLRGDNRNVYGPTGLTPSSSFSPLFFGATIGTKRTGPPTFQLRGLSPFSFGRQMET